jgi:hypothetical protein
MERCRDGHRRKIGQYGSRIAGGIKHLAIFSNIWDEWRV